VTDEEIRAISEAIFLTGSYAGVDVESMDSIARDLREELEALRKKELQKQQRDQRYLLRGWPFS
jgi:hypothetical protein